MRCPQCSGFKFDGNECDDCGHIIAVPVQQMYISDLDADAQVSKEDDLCPDCNLELDEKGECEDCYLRFIDAVDLVADAANIVYDIYLISKYPLKAELQELIVYSIRLLAGEAEDMEVSETFQEHLEKLLNGKLL